MYSAFLQRTWRSHYWWVTWLTLCDGICSSWHHCFVSCTVHSERRTAGTIQYNSWVTFSVSAHMPVRVHNCVVYSMIRDFLGNKRTCTKIIVEQEVCQPGSADTVCPRPSVTLTFDRLALKLVCKSHLRWGTFIPNLGFRFSNYWLCTRRADKSNAYWPLPYDLGRNNDLGRPTINNWQSFFEIIKCDKRI